MARPSKATQVDTEKILLKHFELHHSGLYTAELTGINRNTVNAYFRTFSEKMLGDISNDFITRQKVRKEQVVTLLERDLAELDDHLRSIKLLTNVQVGNKGENGTEHSSASMQSLKLSIIIARANLKQQIADIDMTPTLDIAINELVAGRLEQQQEFSSKRNNSQ